MQALSFLPSNSLFPRIVSLNSKNLFPKFEKSSKKIIAGVRPALPPFAGVRPALPPCAPHSLLTTQVGTKCLAAVVLDNQDRALRLEWVQWKSFLLSFSGGEDPT